MDGPTYCFSFNCSGGEYEIKAMLLAASLRRYAEGDPDIVIGVPEVCEASPPPRRATIAALEGMGARIETVTNDVTPTYPYANKIGCLGVPTSASRLIFLDNDIVCLRPFRDDPLLHGPNVCVKLADECTFSDDDEIWRLAYETCGTTMPETRYEATVTGKPMPPYFNAGFIAVESGSGLHDMWAECCRKIDADGRIPNKRPWLDQVALPVAVRRMGLEFRVVPARFNFPAHLDPVPTTDLPYFCHYHSPDVIGRNPPLKKLILELLEEHPEIRRQVRRTPNWSELLTGKAPADKRKTMKRRIAKALAPIGSPILDRWHRFTTPAETRRRNLIITGIPRSGTSLLSTLINRVENAVALNEVYRNPNLFRVFHNLRRNILAGRPVANKFGKSGEMTSNTIGEDTKIKRKSVVVKDANFVLGHKLTIPYLERLDELARQGWSVMLMVRHPAFALASWMRCPEDFPVANMNPIAPDLAHIPFSSEDEDTRRIEVWNHMARIIHRNAGRVEVIRYEDLCDDPMAVIGPFCERFGLAVPDLEDLETRNRKGSYDALDQAFVDRIHAECDLALFDYEPVDLSRA